MTPFSANEPSSGASLEEIIERAAPPPERADPRFFEPAETAPEVFARRVERLDDALGHIGGATSHAEALGEQPDRWLDRFRNTRLASTRLPDWAGAFRSIAERLVDDEQPFARVRRWVSDEAARRWPACLPRGSDALEGPLDRLAMRLGGALAPTLHVERRLNATVTWRSRIERNPALAFVLGRTVVDFLDDLEEMARAASNDRDLIARRFFGADDPGMLVRIESGLGDPHSAGRSVAILHFERGRVVYKPKDLRIARAIAEIASGIETARLATPDLVVRDGYAWERFHAPRPAVRADDPDKFFFALGSWLALLQGLGAVDFWFDNLIADGDRPLFIDFETAAQPRDPMRHAYSGNGPRAAMHFSPIEVGILPTLLPTRDGHDPTDIGCIVAPGQHRTPMEDLDGGLISWTDDGFAPRCPDGRVADAASHFDAFEDGYLRTAREIASPAFAARTDATLRAIADAPVRIIRIDTWTCYRAVRRSCLPRYLADAVWREIALHAVLPAQAEWTGTLREAAVRDLRRLDVPLFVAKLHSRDLDGIAGGKHRGFFTRDAISHVSERLAALASQPEDERVAWLRSGFAMRAGNPVRLRHRAAGRSPATQTELVEWADEIASTLVRRCIADAHGSPTWIGATQDVFNGMQYLSPLAFDMLTGRCGMAAALLSLARSLARPDLRTLALEALAGAARDYMKYVTVALRYGAGYLTGAGGLIATLASEADTRPLANEVHDVASSLAITTHAGADFISGLAGWNEAARAIGEEAAERHGAERPYAPSARARLAPWLDADNAAPPCAHPAGASLARHAFERHGTWIPHAWTDDRHNLSAIDGLPALAVCFTLLARDLPARELWPGPGRRYGRADDCRPSRA